MTRKSVIELLAKGVGTKTTLKNASTNTLEKLLETGIHELIPYHSIYRKLVGKKLSLQKLKKITPELTTFYNWMRLNSVTFPLPKVTYDEFSSNPSGVERSSKLWGDVEYFLSTLESRLGENWALKILSLKKDHATGKNIPRYDLSKVEGVKRLGIPGRQGTVIKLSISGIDYAIKVARKQTVCGDGSTGAMGYLKQARLQQLAAEWGATCPVYAVHCVPGKKEAPFMAMPMMGQRMIDLYPNGEEWSAAHQQQFWNCHLLLDTYVGIAHNDSNCLNVMTDPNGIVKLIDFDRSFLFDRKKILKHGIYINIGFLWIHKCFSANGSGKVLRTALEKLCPPIKSKMGIVGSDSDSETWQERQERWGVPEPETWQERQNREEDEEEFNGRRARRQHLREIRDLAARTEPTGVRHYRGNCKNYDHKAAIFFPPFEIMAPGPAIFAIDRTTRQLSREERAVRLFCRDSTLEHWSYLSKSAKLDLLKVSMYCIRVKKGDVNLAQKIREGKFNESSPIFLLLPTFKKYKKEKYLNIFNNKLYFPRGINGSRHYTRSMDKGVVIRIYELLYDKMIIRGAFGNTPLDVEEIKALLQMVMLCSREIFYDKIRSNKNFVDPSIVQCIVSAAVMIALKVFLEYDWGSYKLDVDFSKVMASRTTGTCSAKLIREMEWDILTTTNWRTCYNVQKRLGHIPVHEGDSAPRMLLLPTQMKEHHHRMKILGD
jgi:hypothetical protein